MAVLRRDLGLVEMGAVAASMMLGTGIFFGPTLTAQAFPNGPAILGFWLAGGAVALCGAWAFGKLAALHPQSGGPYVYVRKAYGDWAAFLFAWTSFTVIAPSSMAVVAGFFADSLAKIVPLSPVGIGLMAIWSILAVTFVNVMGVKSGGRIQSALTGLKVLLVGLLIALLLTAWGRPPPPTTWTGSGQWSGAFVGVLFAVGGWEYAVLASEEVRDPQRTIPRALFIGAAIVIALYLLVVLADLTALGPAGMAAAQSLAPEAAERAWPGSSGFVAAAVLVSALGTLNAITLLGPRATFAAARDRLFPANAARLSRWGTPTAALVVQAGLATAYFLSGTAGDVANYTVLGTGVFIVLSAIALPRLRREAGVKRRRGHALEDAAAFAVALVYAWFLGDLLVEQRLRALIGLGIVGLGLVPFAILRFMRRRTQHTQSLGA